MDTPGALFRRDGSTESGEPKICALGTALPGNSRSRMELKNCSGESREVALAPGKQFATERD